MDHEDTPIFSSAAAGSPARFGELTQRILEGVDPLNVVYGQDYVAVRLWNEWAQMLNTVTDLGEVFVVTGNPSAILGHTRAYPALEFCRAFRHAYCGDGTFDLEFVPWASASFVTRHGSGFSSHFVEFRDETNAIIHKICLTDKTDHDRLVEWVQYHQALRGVKSSQDSLFPPGRWRTIQQRHWFDYNEIETVHPFAVKHLLQSALDERRAIGVVVGNEGVVQSGSFVPKRLNPAQTWVFAGDDIVGLHFDQTSLCDVIIHHCVAPDGGPRLSSMKCFDEEGCLRLAVTPPFDASSVGWNEFLARATAMT